MKNDDGDISLSSKESGYWKQGKNMMNKKVHKQPKNAYLFRSPLWNLVKILNGTTIYKLHQLALLRLMFFQLALPCIDVLDNDNIPCQDHIQTNMARLLLDKSWNNKLYYKKLYCSKEQN
jgi:hypothetical protein